MVKRRPRGEFTVHVKQLNDGDVGIEIKGRMSGRCLIALITYAIQEFMNGSGCAFAEMVKMIEESLEEMEEVEDHTHIVQ
jgi:hypothetical protein